MFIILGDPHPFGLQVEVYNGFWDGFVLLKRKQKGKGPLLILIWKEFASIVKII